MTVFVISKLMTKRIHLNFSSGNLARNWAVSYNKMQLTRTLTTKIQASHTVLGTALENVETSNTSVYLSYNKMQLTRSLTTKIQASHTVLGTALENVETSNTSVYLLQML